MGTKMNQASEQFLDSMIITHMHTYTHTRTHAPTERKGVQDLNKQVMYDPTESLQTSRIIVAVIFVVNE